MSEGEGAARAAAGGKAELRRWARDTRARARFGRGAELDEAVVTAIRGSNLYQLATTVALYLPMRGEVDIEALLQDDKRFVAPRALGAPEPRLAFHLLAGAQLETHAWGMREPAASAPAVPFEEMDLLLVPGLLFDEGGGRLGYGGGYYDRLLAPGGERRRPTTVGVTFEALVVPELPRDAHDVAVDYLVTEAGLRASLGAALG